MKMIEQTTRTPADCPEAHILSFTTGTRRDFRGALTGRADRGLFITTGIFTRDSELEASREGVTPIELVDGMAIVRLMEDFEFGLHPITTYRIDPQFLNRFDE